MPSASFSLTTPAPPLAETPRRGTSAAPATHPVLVSLRSCLDAVSRLQACLSPPPTVEGASPNRSFDAAPSTSHFLADVYERDWEVLTKQLRFLIDATHPDSQQPATENDRVVSDTTDAAFTDGRAVLLAWDAKRPLFPTSESTSTPKQQQEGGDVARLFRFLQRLADALAKVSAAPSSATDDPLAEGSADGSMPHSSTKRHPASTKAQLQVEDLVEPVLLYGCAVVSNLASFVSNGRRDMAQPSSSAHSTSASPSLIPVAMWAKAERDSVAVLGRIVWPFVLTVTRLFQAEKRVLHLLLSVVSNLVSWPGLKIDADTCTFLYRLILPTYTSSAMVAAWVTMLCNLTAAHGQVAVPVLLRLGAVADVQRLSLAVPPSESATTERLVVQSVQLLSNIAMCVFQDGVRDTLAA